MADFNDIATTAFNVAGGLASAKVGYKNAKKLSQLSHEQDVYLVERQARLQEEANRRAYERNLEQWNLENSYNSPSAQMDRLRDAGLNPNLIYGSTDGGTAAHSPQLESTQIGKPRPVDYSNVNANWLNDSLFRAQQSIQMAAQTELMHANAQKAYADAGIKENNLQYQDVFNQGRVRLQEQTIEQNDLRRSILGQQLKMNDKKIEKFDYDIEIAMNNSSISYYKSQLGAQGYQYLLSTIQTNAAIALQRLENARKDGALKEEMFHKIVADARRATAAAIQMENNPYGFQGEVGNVTKLIVATDDIIDGVFGTSVGSFLNKRIAQE